MTENDSSDVRTYPCPSPDDCSFTAGGAAELLEHVNSEHSGEYQRDDWPDTPAGRASRSTSDDDGQQEADTDG
ncbi:hypothetical protein [Natrinema sp. SYSU A 869]|uniref:hypothetical protein n=1 Tax=Natrinema sp. SYSU A 869 TaxID=2871694 RepID=UPI001CA4285F|nr:hypothetical protein [Natrinema sp. SYSU A 869]